MKFGVLQFFGWAKREVPLQTIYCRAVQRAQIMDRAGYDAVWLAEHHFSGYSVCPSVHMMGVHVAANTSKLRIGMAVSLATFYHPIRLAEEVALLDILSEGRVNWGAGRGFDPVEFRVFGVPVEESGKRFHEAVEIVLAAWTSDKLNWGGRYWNFANVEVLPKPVQKPHPPVWLAAGSENAVVWAGKRGYSIMLGPHSTFTENAAHFNLYRSELEANGHSLAGRDIPMARFISIAETDAAAEAISRKGVSWLAASYMNPSKVTKVSRSQSILTLDRDAQIERYLKSAIIQGTADRVISQIEQLREEMHLEYLMIAPLSQSSFTAFTEKVFPHFF